ncbi:hypothetical protein SS50377_24972 [Spironucleus salmonicida]|uniref:Uncharacterized protein n=1 Tax=Spironucleus salmonicida TaxID=348837 RepID=A0A9P8RXU3_9EUKA|nr:hypothetical protein SS50377_24972 [Spironucleus salmonicida]
MQTLDDLFLTLFTDPALADYRAHLSQVHAAFAGQQKQLATLLGTLEDKQQLLAAAQQQSSVLIGQAKDREIRIFQLQKSLENAISQEEAMGLKRKIVEFYEANQAYKERLSRQAGGQEAVQRLLSENEALRADNARLMAQDPAELQRLRDMLGAQQLETRRLQHQLAQPMQDDFDEPLAVPAAPEPSAGFEQAPVRALREFGPLFVQCRTLQPFLAEPSVHQFAAAYRQGDVQALVSLEEEATRAASQAAENLDGRFTAAERTLAAMGELPGSDVTSLCYLAGLAVADGRRELLEVLRLEALLSRIQRSAPGSPSTPRSTLFTTTSFLADLGTFVAQNLDKAGACRDAGFKEAYATLRSVFEQFPSDTTSSLEAEALQAEYRALLDRASALAAVVAVRQPVVITDQLKAGMAEFVQENLAQYAKLPAGTGAADEFYLVQLAVAQDCYTEQSLRTYQALVEQQAPPPPARLQPLFRKTQPMPLPKPKLQFPRLLEVDLAEPNMRRLYSDLYAQVCSAERQVQLLRGVVKTDEERGSLQRFIDVWYQFGARIAERYDTPLTDDEVASEVSALRPYEALLIQTHDVLYDAVRKDPDSIKYAAKFVSAYREMEWQAASEVRKLQDPKPLPPKKPFTLQPLPSSSQIPEPFLQVVESDQGDSAAREPRKKKSARKKRSLQAELSDLIASKKALEPIGLRDDTPEAFNLPEPHVVPAEVMDAPQAVATIAHSTLEQDFQADDLLVQTAIMTIVNNPEPDVLHSPVSEVISQLPASQYAEIEPVTTPRTAIQHERSPSPEVFEVGNSIEMQPVTQELDTGFGFQDAPQPEPNDDFQIGGGDLDFGDIDF